MSRSNSSLNLISAFNFPERVRNSIIVSVASLILCSNDSLDISNR